MATRSTLPWVGLVVLVWVVFGVTAAGEFVYDDWFVIVDNPLVREPELWPRLFTQDSWAGIGVEAFDYRPLPMLSFGLNHLAGGPDPLGYHLVNLVLHSGAVVALFALGRSLGLASGSAWPAAALFAVHPLHAEPVAEVVGRMDLMAGLACLGSLLLHAAGRRQSVCTRVDRRLLLFGAVVAYAIALLSKESALLLPLAAAVMDWRVFKLRRVRQMGMFIGYGVTAAGYLALRFLALGGIFPDQQESLIDNPLAHTTAPLRVISALRVAGLYLRHAVVPVDLSPDYCYAEVLPFDALLSPGALSTVILACGVFVLAWLLARRSGLAAAALALALCTFLPISNLLFASLTVMGDRLFYLPSAGLCLLLGGGLQATTARWRRPVTAAVLVAVAALIPLGFHQARQWRDNLSLSHLAVRNAPACTRGHANLGDAWLRTGRIEEAEQSFLRSLEIYPGFDPAIAGLARVEVRRGRYAEALVRARQALELRPDSVEMLEVAAEASRRQGDFEAARSYLERRVELAPNAAALSDLAVLRWSEGGREAALELWRQATEAPGARAEVWLNLARAYESLGLVEAAAEAYQRFLNLESGRDPGARAAAEERLEELRPN